MIESEYNNILQNRNKIVSLFTEKAYPIGTYIDEFNSWDKNLEFQQIRVVEADIKRTRKDIKANGFSIEQIRDELKHIAIFYCQYNGILYQQSMFEV